MRLLGIRFDLPRFLEACGTVEIEVGRVGSLSNIVADET
jgi:hypothetical protein